MGKRSVTLVVVVASLLMSLPMPTHAQPTNLAFDPSFEEADDVIRNDPAWVKWVTWNDGSAAATVTAIDTTDFIDGKQSYRVEPKGATAWCRGEDRLIGNHFVPWPLLEQVAHQTNLARTLIGHGSAPVLETNLWERTVGIFVEVEKV